MSATRAELSAEYSSDAVVSSRTVTSSHSQTLLIPYNSAMGKSRSATVCIAYMLHRYPHLTPETALAKIRESRPLCEPNDGFMEQLKLYHSMACPDDIAGSPGYQRWLYQKEIEQSVACGRGPELEAVRFEDESLHGSQRTSGSGDDLELRCKKCR